MNQNKHFSNHYIDAISGNPEINYFTPIIKEVFQNIKTPKSVCDLGCGNGLFSIAIQNEYGCELVGVDGNSYALEQAKKRGIQNLHKIDDFCTDTMPFVNNRFDLVICKDVLEHLLKPEFLVAEMTRITKPNGYALIHVPNHFPISSRFKFLFNANIDTFGFFPGSDRWNFPHIRFFTKESLLKLLEMHGFELYLDLSHHYVIFSKVMSYLPNSFLNRNSNFLSAGLTFVFKKKDQ
jgi:2-polyprenyl-3-methyl-5-hydroxy-6-metoxy-1,4-benzoquinol methylase